MGVMVIATEVIQATEVDMVAMGATVEDMAVMEEGMVDTEVDMEVTPVDMEDTDITEDTAGE